MNEKVLNDYEKAEIVAEFLSVLMEELKDRSVSDELRDRATLAAVEMCSAALTVMRQFPKPLDVEKARIFIEAFALGSLYQGRK